MNSIHNRLNLLKALNLQPVIFLPNKDTNFYTIPNETDIFIGFNKSSEKKIEKKNVVMSKKIMVKMTTMTNISILHALKIKDMLPTKNHKWCVCQGF